MTRAIADPVLQLFCGAILATALMFFWRTHKDYARPRQRLGNLHSGLEDVLGTSDLPQALFEQLNLERMIQNTDKLERPFVSTGLEARWQRLSSNMTFYIEFGHGSVPEEVLQSIFSPCSLERSYIANGTGGRSAFLTSLGVLGTSAYGDLVTAVLFVFIITLVAYLINFSSNQEQAQSLGQQVSDVAARQSYIVDRIGRGLQATGIDHEAERKLGVIRIS